MKTIILGGGPSGLGVAWGLVEAGQRDILIIEKSATLGGLSGSFRYAGCTLDFGPHRFSPEYPDLIARVRKLLGDDLLEVSNEHAVVFEGRVYRYPPVLSDFLNVPTVWTSLRVVGSYLLSKIRRRKRNRTGFEQIVIDRFGPAMYERVIRPMCLKVWGETAGLDPDFADLRFSVPSFLQLARKMLNAKATLNDKAFFYPKQGFQQLWDRLAEYLVTRGVEIKTSAVATEVGLAEDRVTYVTINDGGKQKTYETEYLINTIPIQNFLPLLQPNPLAPKESSESKFADRGMLLVLVLSRRAQAVLPARVVLFPEGEYVFNRLCEQNQFSESTVPRGHSAVLADILAEVDSDTWHLSDAEIIERVVSDIAKCQFLRREEILETKVFRVPRAYPLPTAEREGSQRRLNAALSRFVNLLSTGRFASSDYNNSHTALRKGFLAARNIVDKRELSDWYASAEAIRKTAIRD